MPVAHPLLHTMSDAPQRCRPLPPSNLQEQLGFSSMLVRSNCSFYRLGAVVLFQTGSQAGHEATRTPSSFIIIMQSRVERKRRKLEPSEIEVLRIKISQALKKSEDGKKSLEALEQTNVTLLHFQSRHNLQLQLKLLVDAINFQPTEQVDFG